MNAVILTIGDELLIGQVLNSNAAWLGEQLSVTGIDLIRSVAVGDDVVVLESEIARALEDAELVIATGGLGPTHDDVTREALAAYYRVELKIDEEVYASIQRRFANRNRRMPRSNERQAMVPEGFTVLPNPVGTAPGLWMEDGRGRMLAVVPGVPHEMKHLFENEVKPRLRRHTNLRIIEHRTLRTAGIRESALQEKIGDLTNVLSSAIRLAFLPGTSGVRLRLTAFGETREEVRQRLQVLEDRLRNRIEPYVYGTNEEGLESVVGKMLRDRGLTIAVAESCTGGHVAHQITNVSGSSTYLLGGVVAYSNGVKTSLLGVDAEMLEREGAVSQDVASQMAEGVRTRFGADIGISTTGIAGPTGGSPEKPVGTVWIGYSDARGTESRLLHLFEERLLNKEMTTTLLLDHVRRNLIAGRPER